MKLTNIWTAHKSTWIGIGITALTSIYQGLSQPPINWKAIGIATLGGAILALTDILKENQTQA